MIANKAEADFAATLTARGLEYEHQPPPFHLSYRPDFYVPTLKCYYEVVGTRQALWQNAPKIAAFLRTYPEIQLKLVNARGELLTLPNGLGRRNKTTSQASQAAFAKGLGVSSSYLNDVIRGRRRPGPKLLKALGIQRVVSYRPVKRGAS